MPAGSRPNGGFKGSEYLKIYFPFTNLHAGGPDALFAGRENVIEGVFKTLESLEPAEQSMAG
jgi:hypothetical protein